MHYNIT